MVSVTCKKTSLDPVWATISEDCKALLKRMLTYDPAKRISASEAMKHSFITKFSGKLQVSGSDLQLSLNNLRSFRTQVLFQKAVLTYIASQQLLQQDEAKIRKIFDTFDLNRDGQLTKEEIIAGYSKLYGDSKKAKKQADQIMKNVDLNNNGLIDYNGTLFARSLEFLVANLQQNNALNEENLRKAFDFYDQVLLAAAPHIFRTKTDKLRLKNWTVSLAACVTLQLCRN